MVEVREAHRPPVLLYLAAIELGAGVLANEDGRHAGFHATRGELLDLGMDLLTDLFGDGLAVDDLGCHGPPVVGGADGQSFDS